MSHITISEGYSSIEDYAFSDYVNLQSISIANTIVSIGNLAFSGCSSLESITIPNSVTSIGDYAFYNCSKLEEVIIPKHLTEEEGWEERIFGNNVPENIEIYDNAQAKTDEGLSK